MDEPCPIQVLSFSCIKNETTEVVSQKSNFKGSPHLCQCPFFSGFFSHCFQQLFETDRKHGHGGGNRDRIGNRFCQEDGENLIIKKMRQDIDQRDED